MLVREPRLTGWLVKEEKELWSAPPGHHKQWCPRTGKTVLVNAVLFCSEKFDDTRITGAGIDVPVAIHDQEVA